MEAAGTHAPPGAKAPAAGERASFGRGRLLRVASDERLVARVRAGSDAAFAELWDRYHRPLLSYCRHMLGSHAEAEDAVQHVFTSAFLDIRRGGKRELRLRPWLYRIARNQCITILRARRPVDEFADDEPSLVGLSEQVAERAELRDLLRDVASLPDEQREAIVLAELHDNSHAEVAEIIGCDREKVKSLVFQARASLIKDRRAREISCAEIQRQLSVLRGGSLRRSVLRRHLAECEACRLFHAEVKRQRAALSVVLPVIPVGVLKAGAGTALAAAGTSACAGTASGTAAAVGAKLGVSAALVKGAAATVAVTTVAAGSAATVKIASDPPARDQSPPARTGPPPAPGPAGVAPALGAAGAENERPARKRGERRRSRARPGLADGRRAARPKRAKAVTRPERVRPPRLAKGAPPAKRRGRPSSPAPRERPARERPQREPRPKRVAPSEPLIEPEPEAPLEDGAELRLP